MNQQNGRARPPIAMAIAISHDSGSTARSIFEVPEITFAPTYLSYYFLIRQSERRAIVPHEKMDTQRQLR